MFSAFRKLTSSSSSSTNGHPAPGSNAANSSSSGGEQQQGAGFQTMSSVLQKKFARGSIASLAKNLFKVIGTFSPLL